MPENTNNLIAKEKKKYKLTDEEYSSLPSYIRVYAEKGRSLPSKWMTDYRKKVPAQPTRADTTFRQLTDQYGRPTGKQIGFDITKPAEKTRLRTFEIAEAKKEIPEKLKPPKSTQEAYRRKISGFTKDIGKLSETAKRLGELDIEAEPILQQIEALNDSIKIASKKFKVRKNVQAKKALLSGKTKLTTKEKSTAEIVRANINRSLRAGVPIDRIREMIQDNWGMTLEEFNQIYKKN